jgi:hypothetical protein
MAETAPGFEIADDVKDKDDQNSFLKKYGMGGDTLTPADRMLIENEQAKQKELGDIVHRQGQQQQEYLTKLRAMEPPGPRRQQNIPETPKPQFQNPFNAFSSPMVLLATLGSLFTRQPAIAAFKSAAAALEGYHKGDEEAIKLQTDNWKNQVNEVLEQNEVELERYRQAWEKYRDDFSRLQAEMQATAAGFKDEIMAAQLKYAGPQQIFELIEKRIEAQARLKESLVDVEKKRAEIEKTKTQTEMLKRGGFDQDTLDFMADQYLAGDKSVMTNLGRGVQGARNIELLRETINRKRTERGMGPEDILEKQREQGARNIGANAEARTAATRSANLDIILTSVQKAAPQAIELSEKVPRGSWVPINRLVQMGQASISDSNLKNFRLANIQLAELWARAMNPTGVMRNEDRAIALDILNLSDSPSTYRGAVETLINAIKRERSAVEEFRASRPGGQSQAKVPEATPAASEDQFQGFTVREKPSAPSAPDNTGQMP